MIKKFSLFISVIFLTSCIFLPNVEHADQVSLELMSSLGNNVGKIISLRIASNGNFPSSALEERRRRCEALSGFAFTFHTPKKRPSDRRYYHPEFNFLEDGVTRGRFQIHKSDIYLIHEGRKIFPNKIFWRDETFETIESSPVAYSNYNKYGTTYLTFPIPCTSLTQSPGALSTTRLIISKIYKDDKIIKSNIEFRFLKSKQNRGYSIWLE